MAQRRKASLARESASERVMRDQEVVRANRELAAYFKGRRTEREARAALKIIKAFVRTRERMGEGARPPLPGHAAAKTPDDLTGKKSARGGGKRRRKVHRRLQEATAPLDQAVSVSPDETGRDES
jgi:hypothetical protein